MMKKKIYSSLIVLLLLILCKAAVVYASDTHVNTEKDWGNIDAISSATGRVGHWMELYPKYGILVVQLPQEDGYRWVLSQDENSKDTISAVRSGIVNHIFYAGFLANVSDGTARIRFELYKEEKNLETLFADLLIQNSKIIEVTDYGTEKQN